MMGAQQTGAGAGTPTPSKQTADATSALYQIADALRIVLAPGQVTECRILDAVTTTDKWPRTYSGYFDDADKLAQAVRQIKSAKGFYFVPNPVKPVLLARAVNKIKPVAPKESTTGDADIECRHWLLIDCDAKRPSGVSADDTEHQAALIKAQAIRDELTQRGWPMPILADSGNGGHLMYGIDLPTDDGGLVKQCLEALAKQFDDEQVSIDRTVFNPARIWKLYGTVAGKGDADAAAIGRPQRMAKLIEAPEQIEIVPAKLLNVLAAQAPVEMPKPQAKPSNGQFSIDIDQWIVDSGLEVRGPQPYQGGRKWILPTCPWNPQHRDNSAFIIEHSNGKPRAGCKHDSCIGKHWYELRDVVEPGWRDSKQRRNNGETEVPLPWPDPKRLPGLIEVEPFRLELLPEVYQPWIQDIAERMQCPIDFPAVAAIVTTASVVGRQIGLRPKRRDDWTVVPNLWGAAVARPSLLKSPAIEEPKKMLGQLEREARKAHEAAVRQYNAKLLVRKAGEKQRDKDITAAVKEGNANAVAAQWLEDEEQEPIRRRFIINDATVEKVGVLLKENPHGLLAFRDELVGLWRSLDKDGQEGARAFYLEAWNGNGSFTYDRIGRGTLDIDACCLSILGGIQPGPLRSYMRDAVRGGGGDDGLLQRFQLLVWPDVSKEWRNVDRWPETTAKQRARGIYQRLADIDVEATGAMFPDDEADIPYLRFNRAAQQQFDDWRAVLEARLRGDDESDAFLAHLGKYRSLVPSLALLFHLVDIGEGEVGEAAIDRALAWVTYLESHARRVYGGLADPQQNPARALSKRLLSRQLADGFSLRDVYQPHWSQLDSRELATTAVEVLESLDWLRRADVRTGGRPTENFRINPKIFAQAGGLKSIKSPADLPFAPFETPGGDIDDCNGHDADDINALLDEAADIDGEGF